MKKFKPYIIGFLIVLAMVIGFRQQVKGQVYVVGHLGMDDISTGSSPSARVLSIKEATCSPTINLTQGHPLMLNSRP